MGMIKEKKKITKKENRANQTISLMPQKQWKKMSSSNFNKCQSNTMKIFVKKMNIWKFVWLKRRPKLQKTFWCLGFTWNNQLLETSSNKWAIKTSFKKLESKK